MYGDLYSASEAAKLNTVQAERNAARNWRFRNLKTKEQVLLTSVITSVLGLFLK